MMDSDYKLLYTRLEELELHNVCPNPKKDKDYLETSRKSPNCVAVLKTSPFQ